MQQSEQKLEGLKEIRRKYEKNKDELETKKTKIEGLI